MGDSLCGMRKKEAGAGSGGKEMESTRPKHLCFDEHSTLPRRRILDTGQDA